MLFPVAGGVSSRTSFNSLFEMRVTGTRLMNALGVGWAFNSLFEMLFIVSLLFILLKLVTFNSLFEMPVSVSVQPGLWVCQAFNSLFEMLGVLVLGFCGFLSFCVGVCGFLTGAC